MIFDDCWNDIAWVGTQPAPKSGVHNSGWVRDPGTMLFRYPDTLMTLEAYVKDLLTTWNDDPNFTELNKFQLQNSDIITYHNYSYIDNHQNAIDTLRKYGRPLICTEYMARRNASVFQTIMPMLKKGKVGAINWGFVSGKTNTIFAWDTPLPAVKEPPLWFHDILRQDGTPFSKDEIRLIKELTGKTNR